MDAVVLAWTVACAGLVFASVAHVVHQRLARPADAFVFINRALAAMVPVVALAAYFVPDAPEQGTLALILHSFCCLLFLFLPFVSFYGIVEHAVRARISMELYRAPEGLSLSRLHQRYDSDVETKRRLDELVAAGFLNRRGDHLALTAKGRLFADVARFSKRFFTL